MINCLAFTLLLSRVDRHSPSYTRFVISPLLDPQQYQSSIHLVRDKWVSHVAALVHGNEIPKYYWLQSFSINRQCGFDESRTSVFLLLWLNNKLYDMCKVP